MYQDCVIAAVVPAHNEEAHVGQVVATMPEYVDHIVVVDDGSTDGTSAAAQATGDGRLVVVRHGRNLGVGRAVVAGHRKALELGADIVCVLAGDGQMDPTHLPRLLDPVAGGLCEMAKANRFFSSTSFESMPRYRVIGNIALSLLNKIASGYWNLFDPQNGYVAIRRQALEAIPLDSISSGYALENDILVSMNIVGARVADVPVPALYADEHSEIRLPRVVPDISSLLLRGFFRRIWQKYVVWSFSPVALLLFSGLALLAAGGTTGAVALVRSGTRGRGACAARLSGGLLLTGTNLLLGGFVLDICESRQLDVRLDQFGGMTSRPPLRRSS